MQDIENLNIDVYGDGANFDSIVNLNDNSLIKGFTTNPTLMRKAGVENYKDFALNLLKIIRDKPISFEVFSDDIGQMEKQAREISSWGNNVNVKIPVTNTKGISTIDIIKNLSKDNVKLNITAVFTLEQVKQLISSINIDSETIISIFAGRIADTGIDPVPLMSKSVELAKINKNIKILWASPRELLNIFHAENSGCQIITVAEDIIKKLSLINKNLEDFSIETVKMFYDDAQKAGYKIL
ncbi:transaldolase [bacterium]|nr:transaldolase [bacterium]